MLPEDDRGAIRAECTAVLHENWRQGVRGDGVPFGYTCPSPGHYPWQWYWDSCFTAITWRRVQPDRSRIELESLLGAMRPDGFVGHTIFWNTPLRGIRRLTYNMVPGDRRMTASIQPPLLAWAWKIAVGDPAAEPRIAAHLDWLERERDLEGDGLLWIVQPDESGLDASPQFDRVWGPRAHALPGFVLLVRRNRRYGYDLRRIVAAGGPALCEVTTNVLYGLSRLAAGRPSITGALVDRLWDEERGLFFSQAKPDRDGPLVATCASLAPLALPDLPEAIGRRMIEEHLLREDRFWLPYGMPSVAADEHTFTAGETVEWFARRYWRGPMWVNVSWLAWLGFVRLGYTAEAAELARRTAAAVRQGGLREYYDPYTGAGLGQRHFGWSTLVLEMTEPDARAASSYLG